MSEINTPENSKILVVDDVAKNIQVVGNILKNEGFQVMPATSGEQALKVIEKQKPDLILLDLMMPGMDGTEVCRKIKEKEEWSEIPIVFLTASNENEHLVQAFEVGAVDYVTKPFQAPELLARVRTHLKLRFFSLALIKTNQELTKQLQEASNYVRSALPDPLTAPSPIETDWKFKPSNHLGGDAFGYHWIDDRYFAFYLLDVCGHGVGASLLAVSVINMIRSGRFSQKIYLEPGTVLSELNKAFPMSKNNNMFFTIWYGIYEKETRLLKYASAGHPPALLHQDEEGEIDELSTKGMMIGLDPTITFRGDECVLPEKSEIYIYSDGVYELKDAQGEYLGLSEFKDFLGKEQGSVGLDKIWDRAHQINGADELEDDFSILKVRF